MIDDLDLDIEDLKKLHDKAYNNGKITRERAADDMVFYHITQWDENTLGESSLGYKGEFNIIRKAGRQIIGDLRANPVQVDFQAKNEDDNESGDLVDGLYRSVDRLNSSVEAYDNANSECVVCGVGAWELFNEYESNQIGDENQVVRRRPLYEANNNVYWDPNAKAMDKSDADYVSVIVPYSKDGMEQLAEDLTGEEYSTDLSNFKSPEHSYTFPWVSGKNEVFYAVRFYHRVKIKDTVLRMADPFGQEMYVLKSSTDKIMDELLEDGYSIISEKKIKRDQITLYISNGDRILKKYIVPCDYIPVVPQYGERAFVEGEEHYEGVTRLAKDPQRLRNFQMSYLADIVSRSPRPQPIFIPEQLQGFEDMYQDNGADSFLPHLFQNFMDANGNLLPLGPVGQMPEQPVPSALIQSINLSREAVGDVAPANVSQDIADVDLSGKAVAQLQARLDEQSIVYQQNRKFALRRDGEIFASMSKYVLDAPRTVTLTAPDGTRTNKQIMETVMDKETGEMVTLNDLTAVEFEVFSDIGPSYTTKKEETFDRLGAMGEKAALTDPGMAKMFMLKQTEMLDGVDMTDIRDYARKQLILGGYREPDQDSEEEMAWVKQAQQNQVPDANMAIAQAEQAKADAAMADVQRKAQLDQFTAQTNTAKVQVQEFDAATKRLAVQVDAEEADASINFKRIDAMTKRLAEVNKTSQFRARVNQDA